jgi:4'-phosphopantetheinyl transferase
MHVHTLDALRHDTSSLSVQPETVAVYFFSQRASPNDVAWCASLLMPDERARAARFVTRMLQEDYIVAHGVLRHLLQRYTSIPASAIQLRADVAGKPSLDPVHVSASSISFNLTHSGGRAAIAVSDGRAVGIDLEAPDRDIDALSIARNYFFGEEYDAIARAPQHAQRDVFLQYWVAKEAVLKGEGIGLGFPLDRFQIRFASDRQFASVMSHDVDRLAPDWIVRPLSDDDGWHAAVAARGGHWVVDVGL